MNNKDNLEENDVELENIENAELIVQSKFTRECFEWVECFVTAIVVGILIMTFIFRCINVDGSSMMNTLHDQDKIILTNLFYQPKCGDVVVISHGEYLDEPIIKRIIAVEGQTLSINFESGDVIVDGVVTNEPYIKDPTTKKGDGQIPEVIPEGYVFVMGDNRNNSLDSRYKAVGLIDKRNILGKAEFIIFPFSRMGVVH